MAYTGAKARNGRRGFFFTGAAAVLLVILTISVILWINAANARTAREPLLTQAQAVGAFEKSLEDYDSVVLLTASELALYDVVEEAKAGGYDALGEVQTDFCDKLEERLAPSAGGTAGSWGDRVTQLGSQLGLAITLNFGTCSITQAAGDAQHVQVTYPLTYTIVGTGGSPRLGKSLAGVSGVPIQGYDDAYVYKRSEGLDGINAVKKFFFNDAVGDTPAEAGPDVLISNAIRGKGYAYGKTARSSDGIVAAERASHILVSSNPSADLGVMNQYAGVIITVSPTLSAPAAGSCNGNDVTDIITETGSCVDCLRFRSGGEVCGPASPANSISAPFVVAPAFSLSGSDRPYVMIDSQSWSNAPAEYHRIMDVEQMRAMAVCGFYVESGGPSFLQRLLNSPNPGAQPSGTGIEGFVVGRWANNNADLDTDAASSVDWKYYGAPQATGPKVKGMPGCRVVGQCTYDASGDLSPVGHFALDTASGTAYGAAQIMCDAGSSCERTS